MSKIQLYIAASIDGFIAREDGGLDWLELPNPSKVDYGYAQFLSGIDTVVTGRKTYQEVLGFGVEWPYKGCKTYVVTSSADLELPTPDTFSMPLPDAEAVRKLRGQSQKNIWLLGGGQLVTHFLNLGELDEIILCMIPVILGKGIRLFPGEPRETGFDLKHTQAFDTGAVLLTWQKKLDG